MKKSLLILLAMSMLIFACEKQPASIDVNHISVHYDSLQSDIQVVENSMVINNKSVVNYMSSIEFVLKNSGNLAAYKTIVDVYITYSDGSSRKQTENIGDLDKYETRRIFLNDYSTDKSIDHVEVEVNWYD